MGLVLSDRDVRRRSSVSLVRQQASVGLLHIFSLPFCWWRVKNCKAEKARSLSQHFRRADKEGLLDCSGNWNQTLWCSASETEVEVGGLFVTATEPALALLTVVVLVAKLGLTLFIPMDCNPLGSPDHGISQARTLEWVATSFSR